MDSDTMNSDTMDSDSMDHDPFTSFVEALIVGKPQTPKAKSTSSDRVDKSTHETKPVAMAERIQSPQVEIPSIPDLHVKPNLTPPQSTHDEGGRRSGSPDEKLLASTPNITAPSNTQLEPLKLECGAAWIVLRSSPQQLLGVFTSESGAMRCAEYFVKRHGHPEVKIIDTDVDTGFCPPDRAQRRLWPDGVSETSFYITPFMLTTVKVFQRAFASPPNPPTAGIAFLSLDRSETGLIVIGASRTKTEAWKECRSHFAQFSRATWVKAAYWVDGKGMHHMKGYLDNREHHWCVEPHPVLE
ncbi:uncharacterized protein BP5553_10189 [Venustampulla echinocandica]|uniref:Uncharacterized protein n=1 Tax=Venustampulla echinocandica TaxID=2656787 RepID=A0A370TAK5_9HELO|nr:uncharacterized protein BP5553_10189 [Venustampulla echinocandica]RDL30844.1 hypothetical protein BP5553_10189 [Venustampulla echinocandica]